jgi:hypothetical protein
VAIRVPLQIARRCRDLALFNLAIDNKLRACDLMQLRVRDVCHGPPDRQRELKTWISEDAGPAASIDALMAVAAYFTLDKQDAVQILAEVERTVSTWRARGRELGMSAAELEQFADAFEHREREVAQSILREKRG